MILFISLIAFFAVLLPLFSVWWSRPRVYYEFSMSRESWNEIRKFWEQVGRL